MASITRPEAARHNAPLPAGNLRPGAPVSSNQAHHDLTLILQSLVLNTNKWEPNEPRVCLTESVTQGMQRHSWLFSVATPNEGQNDIFLTENLLIFGTQC